MKRFVAVFFLLSGLLVAGGANAGRVAVTFAQVGSNVVVTAAGSLTSTGVSFATYIRGQIDPSLGLIVFGNYSNFSNAFFSTTCSLSPSTAFGTGGSFPVSAFSGDLFYLSLSANRIFVPPNFPGGSINSTITLSNTQLSSLGLTSGGVTYTCGADTITVNVPTPSPTPSAVPTLSQWTQLLLGLMVLTMIGWHFHRERSY